MTTGGSLFLIAIGAILRFAVNDSIKDVDLSTVGLILMIVGAVGLAIGLYMARRARTVLVDDRPVVDDRPRY
jgi:ABC-type antimicrobial peptide transport system permease subunit